MGYDKGYIAGFTHAVDAASDMYEGVLDDYMAKYDGELPEFAKDRLRGIVDCVDALVRVEHDLKGANNDE